MEPFDLLNGSPRIGSELGHCDALCTLCLSLFGRKYLLNTYLINEMPTAQVRQMRPFLIIC